jgi:hypothetical protein
MILKAAPKASEPVDGRTLGRRFGHHPFAPILYHRPGDPPARRLLIAKRRKLHCDYAGRFPVVDLGCDHHVHRPGNGRPKRFRGIRTRRSMGHFLASEQRHHLATIEIGQSVLQLPEWNKHRRIGPTDTRQEFGHTADSQERAQAAAIGCARVEKFSRALQIRSEPDKLVDQC